MKLTPKTSADIQLEQTSFTPNVYADAYRQLADQGELVNVTSWVRAEMGFSQSTGRVNAMLTADLWRVLVRISPWAKRWQTVTSRGRDILWMASYALQQARTSGRNAYTFQAFLPTDDQEEAFCTLRVEYSTCESGRPVVLIGFAEQLALA
ncbi:hypothetical protein NG895_02045 [Aeoliella sp. ICT_H6.2]|uniref:Uncharacterized protein n=1 Tax=Aeoliella straminimaris TaxID=2954799 RepID=A0A9X2F5M6_9BACT|nr:hypothetical protein [Aeoliella straminimaris]MCO6042677.1 hypothetical protein [Aeoliella straminimaris]